MNHSILRLRLDSLLTAKKRVPTETERCEALAAAARERWVAYPEGELEEIAAEIEEKPYRIKTIEEIAADG